MLSSPPGIAYLRQIPFSIRVLTAGILINRMGGYVTVFLALILTVRHVSPSQISLALILSGIFSITGSAAGGMSTTRIGGRHTVFLSMMGSGIFTTLLIVPASFTVTVLLICLISFFNRAYAPAAATIVGRVSPPGQRVKMFAFYSFAFNVGAAIGPLIATFLLTRSLDALFLIDATTSGIFALVALRVPADARSGSATRRRVMWVLGHDMRFLLFCVSVVCVGLVYAQTSGALPLTFTAHRLSLQFLGYLLSANAIAVIVFQLPVSALIRKLPPWLPLTSGGFFICAAFGIFLAGISVPVLIINTVLRTLGEMVVMPVRPVVALLMSTEDSHASYQGALSTAQTIGQVTGPSAGALAYSFGASIPWTLSCVLLVPAAVLPFVLLHKKRCLSRDMVGRSIYEFLSSGEITLDWPSAPASLYDGVVWGGHHWWPSRPLLLRQETLAGLHELTEHAARLILEACTRRAATAGELREALEVPPGQAPLLDPDEPLAEHLLAAIRPDIVTQAGVPKFVEVNIEGSLGGVPHADLLSSRYLEFYSQRGITGLESAGAATATRSRLIRDSLWLEPGAFVVIPAFGVGMHPGLDDHRVFAAWQEPSCVSARLLGLDMATFPLSELTVDGRSRLLAGGRVADGVFRLFDAATQPASPGLDALAQAVRARTIAMFTPEATFLLSNKIVLAWLWEDADRLPGPDRAFIRRHVPWTARAQTVSQSEALAGQDHLVLKPGGGYGGTGVIVGPAVPARTWRHEIDQAAARGGYVVQEYVAGDTITMSFTHRETGEVRTDAVRFVLGPFVFGGQAAGVFVRHGAPGTGAVLNGLQGAFPNTALLAADSAEHADL